MDCLACDGGKLVSIQAGGWHSHWAHPVIVEEGELVGEALVSVWVEICVLVHQDIVRGGGDCPLCYTLTHQEEVIPLRQGNNIITHSAGGRVDGAATGGALGKQAGVYPFADHDEAEAGVEVEGRKAVPDGSNFRILNVGELSVPHTISIHQHPLWEAPVHPCVVGQCVGNSCTEVVGELLV